MPRNSVISVFFTIAMLIAVNTLFAQDTLSVSPTKPAQESNSGLKSKVVYSADDSVRFDVSNQKMYLFGNAKVVYEDMELKANYIEFDMAKNVAYSRGKRDSLRNAVLDSMRMPVGDPVFADGAKTFNAKELTYNFQTKKGKIKDVTTKEGEAYIHAVDAKKDTGDVYYIRNGRYTTCNLPHPHFYLQATKIKIIPDDKIIIGPSYLAVCDVPTPLGLPFGVFPNKSGRKSGVLIPAYGESELGFFLKDGGYYFGFSDYFDLALRGDVYSKGSYGLKTNTNYAKRYKYNGFFGLSFAQIQVSEEGFPDYSKSQDYFVRWQHVQDPKSNPSSRFSANVNAGSKTYQTFNSNNANDYLSNAFQSNISWIKAWQGKPYNLAVNLAHSQTKRPRVDKLGSENVVDLTFPEIAFTRNRFYFFQKKNQIGKPNVFQKIGASFVVNAKNQITTGDSILFKPQSIEKMRNGIKASTPISTSMNLGPFVITPSAMFNSYSYFQSYNKYFRPDSNDVVIDTVRSFRHAYDYSAAVSLTTRLYGMYSFKNARVKAIRHVIVPSISYSYRPDFSEKRFGYYDSVQYDTSGIKQLYSHFQNGIFGYPAAGKSGFLIFGINNNLEMKLRPAKKDTTGTDRKVILIENISINSSYNLAADSMKWSAISFSARTKIAKKFDVLLSGIIDPYVYDTTLKKRIDRYELDSTGKIGTLTSAMLSVSTSLRSLIKKKDPKAKTPVRNNMQYENELAYIMAHPDYYVDFNVPWDFSFFYNVVYAKPALRDTFIQSFTFNGNLSVTPNWKVGFRSGFDFVNKDFTFTSFDIYRDLHCWEMRLNWVPFGFRKSYMITIAVKASVLQDLKLNRTRNWYDYN